MNLACFTYDNSTVLPSKTDDYILDSYLPFLALLEKDKRSNIARFYKFSSPIIAFKVIDE
jgi:hypothetical protein